MICIYVGIVVALNIPYVQRHVASYVSARLSEELKARVSVGNLSVGFLNRVVIGDLRIDDRSGQEMLSVARLSAKLDITPLFVGRFSLGNVQLFGFNIRLERDDDDSELNCQFVIDALSPHGERRDFPLDLRVNSLLIRRGSLTYDVRSARETPGRFNPRHLDMRNLLATLSLKALRTDSIHAAVKRMSADEANSGFSLRRLSLKAVGGAQQMQISDFSVELPHTLLLTDTIRVDYNTISAFRNAANELQVSFHLLPSKVTLADLSAFVPAFSSFVDPLSLEVWADGNLNDLECRTLEVSSNSGFRMVGTATVLDLTEGEDAMVDARLERMTASRQGVEWLARNLSGVEEAAPALRNMGGMNFRGQLAGYVNALVAYGQLDTEVGMVRTDLRISSQADDGRTAYQGRVSTKGFQIGTMLADNKLGRISLDIDVQGNHRRGRLPDVVMKGVIDTIDYSGYAYHNITLDGHYQRGGFKGLVLLDDPHGSVHIDGEINTVSRPPAFHFRAEAIGVRPDSLQLTDRYPGAYVSVVVEADFTGGNPDDMAGSISVDSLNILTPDTCYLMRNFTLTASHDDEGRRLAIRSDFMSADISGQFGYRTLANDIRRLLRDYLPTSERLATSGEQSAGGPSNIPDTYALSTEDCSVEIDIHEETKLLAYVLCQPLGIYAKSTVHGRFQGPERRLQVDARFPRLNYGQRFFENAMFTCDNHTAGQLHARLRLIDRRPDGKALSFAFDAIASDHQVHTTANWGNDAELTYSGRIEATVRRQGSEETEDIEADSIGKGQNEAIASTPLSIDIAPTHIIIGDTVWNIHAAQVLVDSGRVYIHDLGFSHDQRHMRIHGIVSPSPYDTLHIDLSQFDIGYIFDLAQVGVSFSGEATGHTYACGITHQPFLDTSLRIKGFGINGHEMGEADIRGQWHNETQGIYLEADIQEADIAHTYASGYVYPLKPKSGLDLHVRAENSNVSFVHHYMRRFSSYFRGRATGNVDLYGSFREMNMRGLALADADMKVDALGVTYHMSDTLRLHPLGVTFPGNTISDREGHRGVLTGGLGYEHFQHMTYDFQIDTDDNMLLMDLPESPDRPFHGTAYGQGRASISGSVARGANIVAEITAGRGTQFYYIRNPIAAAVNDSFITFVDRTPSAQADDEDDEDDPWQVALQQARRRSNNQSTGQGGNIRMNLGINATPNANLRILMDPTGNDQMSCFGTGNLQADYYNRGDFRMYGTYTINRGSYRMNVQNIIRKELALRDGSTLVFAGDPYQATMNMTAVYTVPSARLEDLMANASSFTDQTNVRVDCIMNISGTLGNTTIDFDLDLPNERDEVVALVKNYAPTDEDMYTQALYLLSIGRFYTPQGVSTTNQTNVAASALSSTLSGQISQALSNIINNNNWTVGTYLSTGDEGWSDVEFQTMLSGQLLNNRLLINGNFGYRESSLTTTNFVGDFEAEWLVTPSGNIRLKGYNETNDRYYTRTNLTTQGIGIIFRRDIDRWSDLIFWSRWKLRQAKQQDEGEQL